MSQYTNELLSHKAVIDSAIRPINLKLQNIYTKEIVSIKEIVVFRFPPHPAIYEVFVDEKGNKSNRQTINKHWRQINS